MPRSVVMMESVEEFLREPSEKLLEGFSREQLICVVEHFHLDVGDKRMKENIRGIVKANLIDLGAFRRRKYTVDPRRDSVDMSGCGDAGFEQRKELLLLLQAEVEERRMSLPAGGASQASNLSG